MQGYLVQSFKKINIIILIQISFGSIFESWYQINQTTFKWNVKEVQWYETNFYQTRKRQEYSTLEKTIILGLNSNTEFTYCCLEYLKIWKTVTEDLVLPYFVEKEGMKACLPSKNKSCV